MSSGVDYVLINSIGATILSIMTIIGAGYLLIALIRQGRGKLRVRLLTGLVISDICLGIIVLPPEILYVAGRPMVGGTAGCNTLGFLLTMALFTQHLWTLTIAIATFLLLKYPLSRATTVMEKYSWAAQPLIIAISALHSGLWLHFYGFMSIGNLCYYDGEEGTPDARDLIQFIPRAVTFGTVAILYSMLYRFLRRPDTIQISSHYESRRGSVTGGMNRLTKLVQKKEEDDRPPWEQLEFVHTGHRPWEDDVSQMDLITPATPITPVNPHSTLSVNVSSSSSTERRDWGQRGSDAETLVVRTERQPSAPSPLGAKARFDTDSDLDGGGKDEQTMAEFFQENQLDTGQLESGRPELSATAYFNRQASLLMLYFPLAYVVVFSASLVRLIYGIVTNEASTPVLSIISAWFTLSVGFIDALVYGLAEFFVKRKVRRKMPDRI